MALTLDLKHNLKPYISIQALTGAAKTIDIRYQDKDMAIAA